MKECVHRTQMPLLSALVNKGWNQTWPSFYGTGTCVLLSNDFLMENLSYWEPIKFRTYKQTLVKLDA
jgi:hypothetical protein